MLSVFLSVQGKHNNIEQLGAPFGAKGDSTLVLPDIIKPENGLTFIYNKTMLLLVLFC